MVKPSLPLAALTLAVLALAACGRTPEPTPAAAPDASGALALSVPATGPRTGDTTATGLPLDAPWKKLAYAHAVKHLKHPSWGLTHSERNLQNALALAARERLAVDRDVLFAAAYLHDLGGMPAFEKEGVDHAVRSAELARPLLAGWGFPMAKAPAVEAVILGHVYYGKVAPTSDEARVFHDADLLDFLGAMGIVRLAAATQDSGPAATLTDSLKVSRQFQAELPGKLLTKAAKDQAKVRVAEMKGFFTTLEPYTLGGNAL